jgi:hypothetical protein
MFLFFLLKNPRKACVNEIILCVISVYKKHYPPALHDEVWRLDRIAKDGALHKKLIKAEIVTVEDFLRLLVKDPQRLRSVRIYLVFTFVHKQFSLSFLFHVLSLSLIVAHFLFLILLFTM